MKTKLMLKHPLLFEKVKQVKGLQRHIISEFRPLLNDYIYTAKGGLAKGLRRKGGFGFIPKGLTKEEKFLASLDLIGKTIYDVGGFEGVYTLFFARAVQNNGKVITFEPNPNNYNKINDNVKLNKFTNVRVLQIGLGAKAERATLAFRPTDLGTGTIQTDLKSNILHEKASKAIQVEIDSIDNQIATNHLPKPDFIKIDVEGLELDVLIGMNGTIEKYMPKLFIEIHGANIEKKVENITNIVDYLVTRGYSIYLVESEEKITSDNAKSAIVGHIYCK